MPQYLSPGVYVEEQPGTPPIVGVGTSTAGFIGQVAGEIKMPFKPGRPLDPKKEVPEDFYELAEEKKPILITSWEQFKNHFGDFQVGNQLLAHAVYGFFHNSGTRCYVARVASISDEKEVDAVLKKFEAIDEISILAAPGEPTKAVQEKLIDHCEALKDRFAILDGQEDPGSRTAEAIRSAKVEGDKLEPVKPSQYAALYFPWIEVANPLANPNANPPIPDKIVIPPSGHMAGIYARVDAERGVHKAPANEVVRGALGLKFPVTKAEQDGLNPTGINVIRSFNGKILVWGARTLGGDDNGEYKYVNVRRLMNFLRESIEEGTRWAVFEPNSPPLWQRIIRSATGFLTVVWRDGALVGNTAEQAFFVKCDETTNTDEVRALGQVVTVIGVAVVRPAEFVIFRITQLSGAAG